MKKPWRAGKQPVYMLVYLFSAAVLAARVPAQAAGQQEAHQVEALLVSDIHFEPFRDPGKAVKLAETPVAGWNAILSAPASSDAEAKFKQLEETCHARGDDTTETLWQSSLSAMRAQAKGARFVAVSGDLIAHGFSCKYATLFPNAKQGDYRAFVERTIEYVLAGLRHTLAGVPVYAALGNNDSDCGDYQLDANSQFLADLSKPFTADLRGADQEQAQLNFGAGGYYSALLPAPMQPTRLLVLDNLFMSAHYRSCGGAADAEPAARQMAWLKQQLEAARASNEKVWVMAHIPPGVDPYSTAAKVRDLCGAGKPVMFLSSEALPDALAASGDEIPLAIFAHTHMDEVRLLTPAAESATEKPVAVKMVASISPVDGNMPSFTLATVDPATAALRDYRVIAASNATGIETKWAEEYDFARTYREPAFSSAALGDLISGFRKDAWGQASASQSYLRNYMTGVDMRALALVWQPYVCALTNDSADAYKACACQSAR